MSNMKHLTIVSKDYTQGDAAIAFVSHLMTHLKKGNCIIRQVPVYEQSLELDKAIDPMHSYKMRVSYE